MNREGPAAMLNNPNGAVRYGTPPGAAHGIDFDEQGAGTVTEQGPCQLVRRPKPIADRRFEIAFLGSGVEVFAFAFG
jgi:hypothetical protein